MWKGGAFFWPAIVFVHWETFSRSQKNVPNHHPQLFHTRLKVGGSDMAHFLEKLSESKLM